MDHLRRMPRPRALASMIAAGVAHYALRSPALPGRGHVSEESPVLIVGAHRSGTSMVARLLEAGGLYIGGSWIDENSESRHFSRANRSMLGEGAYMVHDLGWAAPKTDQFIEQRRGHAEHAARTQRAFFGGEPMCPWGWKDPRNCLTLPVWLSIYPHARVIHVLRDGREVALSLSDHHALDPPFALRLWAHYVDRATETLSGLAPSQQIELRYEDLITDPNAACSALAQFAQLPGRDVLSAARKRIDPQRRRRRSEDPRLRALPSVQTLARLGYT